jgi:hypothetical protein
MRDVSEDAGKFGGEIQRFRGRVKRVLVLSALFSSVRRVLEGFVVRGLRGGGLPIGRRSFWGGMRPPQMEIPLFVSWGSGGSGVLGRAPSPRARVWACAVGGALLGIGLGACALAPTPPRGSQSQSPEAVQRAIHLWRPRLGSVVLVDAAAGFALIDIGTAPAPPAGTGLRAFSVDQEAYRKGDAPPPPLVELVVSAFQRRPFLIADLRGGVPKVGDFVVAADRADRKESGEPRKGVAAPKSAESAPKSAERLSDRDPGENAAAASAGVGDSPRFQNAAEAERRIPVRTDSSPSPGEGSSSGVIPGLAPRGGVGTSSPRELVPGR